MANSKPEVSLALHASPPRAGASLIVAASSFFLVPPFGFAHIETADEREAGAPPSHPTVRLSPRLVSFFPRIGAKSTSGSFTSFTPPIEVKSGPIGLKLGPKLGNLP